MKLMDASATNNTAAPSAMAVSSNDSSVTQSGINSGTITVGQQGLNSLNGLKRQVVSGTDNSGKIANNFNQADLQTTLKVASAFIQQAAPLAAKLVGDIGESKQKAANGLAESNLTLVKQALDNGNAEDAAHYQNLADQAKANAASWGDNGSNRIALHAASQALIGGLIGGSAGALNSGSGALAGNLGQQLGASMAATEAKRLGLEESAASTLANSYQQSLATIGGALGGLIAGSASGQNGAGSLGAAAQAGNTAMAVDVYNRQLHQKERQFIDKKSKELADKTCKPGDMECSVAGQRYWNDQLTAEAEAKDDSKLTQQRQAYLNQVATIGTIPGSDGQISGSAAKYLQDAQIARTALGELSGQAIMGSDGKPIIADGAVLTYFSGTKEQRDDHDLYATRLGAYDRRVSDNGSADILVPKQDSLLRAQREANRVGRMGAVNGSALPDTTIEEVALGGGAQLGKAAWTVAVKAATKKTVVAGIETVGSATILDVGANTAASVTPLLATAEQPLLLTYVPTTNTLAQMRNMPLRQRWQVGEQYVQELTGSSGQLHFDVPAGSFNGETITGTGGRFVDAPVPTVNGGVIANEVKTYKQWTTVNGQATQQSVPLSNQIQQQVIKDSWLKTNVPGYDPRWIFLDAPPSPELAQYLSSKGIIYVVHH